MVVLIDGHLHKVLHSLVGNELAANLVSSAYTSVNSSENLVRFTGVVELVSDLLTSVDTLVDGTHDVAEKILVLELHLLLSTDLVLNPVGSILGLVGNVGDAVLEVIEPVQLLRSSAHSKIGHARVLLVTLLLVEPAEAVSTIAVSAIRSVAAETGTISVRSSEHYKIEL